ncbi:MAG: metalloregulator ArsR/SmtB family transcription factor [Patescibacteria group bacterium]|nr:metalloregulator ArsR/SmtB family transcription factor [Patescibacteria group bacterium]
MNLPFKTQAGNFYDDRASLLKCVGDPNCLKIIDVLAKEDNPCVSDITKKLDISISAVSHQLSKLKAMGIVETKRTGQNICYSLTNSENSQLIKKFLEK